MLVLAKASIILTLIILLELGCRVDSRCCSLLGGFDFEYDLCILNSFDLIIIGGGINGVAIADQATKLGKRVVLFEKTVLGAGASSHTSKLAHGGLRYLESFEFALVKESLQERDLLVRTYPDLVTPLPFIFPVYRTSKRPLWQVQIGMWLYDFFSRQGPLPSHRRVTPLEIGRLAPGIHQHDLIGGVVYFDAQMDDLALVHRLATDAKRRGAVILEHCLVTRLIQTDGQVTGVEVLHDGHPLTYEARHVINVSGAWSNTVMAMDLEAPKVQVCPTKGVHILVPQLVGDYALILMAPQDGRIFFVMPG